MAALGAVGVFGARAVSRWPDATARALGLSLLGRSMLAVFALMLVVQSASHSASGSPRAVPIAAMVMATVAALGSGIASQIAQVSQPLRERMLSQMAPRVLSGLGALLYILAPLGALGADGRPPLDRWAPAVFLVGAGALLGQSLGLWAMIQLSRRGTAPGAGPLARLRFKNRHVGTVVAACLALYGLWLAVPSAPAGSTPAVAAVDQADGAIDRAPAAAVAPEVFPSNSILVVGVPAGADQKDKLNFSLDLSTGQYQRLQFQEGRPIWSHDGSKLAFIKSNWNAEHTFSISEQLWLAAPDGSSAELRDGRNGFVSDVAWTNDGAYVDYCFRTDFWGASGLRRLPVGGGEPEELIPESERIDDFALSPDGRWLAYEKDTDVGRESKPWEIRLHDLTTHATSVLVTFKTTSWRVYSQCWTADGKALLALISESMDDQHYSLFRVSIDRPELTQWGKPMVDFSRTMTRLPDGSIACAFLTLASGSATNQEIRLLDPTTGVFRRIDTDNSVTPLEVGAMPTAR